MKTKLWRLKKNTLILFITRNYISKMTAADTNTHVQYFCQITCLFSTQATAWAVWGVALTLLINEQFLRRVEANFRERLEMCVYENGRHNIVHVTFKNRIFFNGFFMLPSVLHKLKMPMFTTNGDFFKSLPFPLEHPVLSDGISLCSCLLHLHALFKKLIINRKLFLRSYK